MFKSCFQGGGQEEREEEREREKERWLKVGWAVLTMSQAVEAHIEVSRSKASGLSSRERGQKEKKV